MVLSGPTMKSPLISGFRQTTTRMESPGARETDSDTDGAAAWARTTREEQTEAVSARANDSVRIFRITPLCRGRASVAAPQATVGRISGSRAQEVCPYEPVPVGSPTLWAKAMYLNWFGRAQPIRIPA